MSRRVVYATCSVLEEENEEVARAWEASEEYARDGWEPWPFLVLPSGQGGGEGSGRGAAEAVAAAEAAEAAALAEVEEGSPAHWRTFLPHVHGTDGFFISRWRRSQGGGCG